MTKDETAKIMAVFKTAYPRYYAAQTETEAKAAVNLWAAMLEEYPAALAGEAAKAIIAVSKYPPTIADMVEKTNELLTGEEMSELEAWRYVSLALRNSGYRSREEWEKLPEPLRKIVSPEILKNWAMAEADSVETVIYSNFCRVFRAKREAAKKEMALPKSTKTLIENAKIGVMPLEIK